MDKVTHKMKIHDNAVLNAETVSKRLGVSTDRLLAINYEMAFAWLEIMGYWEEVARYYVMSPTFFRWWFQIMSYKNKEVLIFDILDMPQDKKLGAYLDFCLSTVNVKPPRVLSFQIVKEGRKALSSIPENKNIKIYDK